MLEKAPVNKVIGKENIQVKAPVQGFHYPDYQITINATSQAEADLELAKILEAKNK
jgi:hypothetical protein